MSLMNLVTKSDLSRAGLYMIAEGVVSLFISDVLPLRCRNVRLQHLNFLVCLCLIIRANPRH